MADHDNNEMEQIQRGLEEFLEKELKMAGEQSPQKVNSQSGKRSLQTIDLRQGYVRTADHFPEGSGSSYGQEPYWEEEAPGEDFYPEGEAPGEDFYPGEETSFGEEPYSGEKEFFGEESYSGEEEFFGEESCSGEEEFFGGESYPGEEESFGGELYPGEEGEYLEDDSEDFPEENNALYDVLTPSSGRRPSRPRKVSEPLSRAQSAAEDTAQRSRAQNRAEAQNRAGVQNRAGAQNRAGVQRPKQPGKKTSPQKKPQSSGAQKAGKRENGTSSKPSGKKPQEGAVMAKKGSKKKKRRKKYRLLKFLIFLAVILGLLAFALYQLVGSVYDKMNFEEISAVSDQPMEEEGVVNILLIGNDSRENGTDGRSDAMILLSISSKTKTIYMTSLLRDMYVEIPGRDGNRLNAAYSFGGPELLMETIEKNFDISVNRYVSVNFEAFANLIDAVDGVDLELSREEIEYVNGYLVEYNMLTGREQGTDNMDPDAAGLVHLNGPQALAYCRNRYIGTDFGRTERQRKVLEAAAGKLPSALLSDYEGLMEGILPNLTTNLTQSECFQLSLMAGRLLTYDIVSDSIPQPGTYSNATIRKMAVLEVDFDANKRFLKEKIYGEVEE